MPSMKLFWQNVKERTQCTNCGNDTLQLQRSNYERCGIFMCDECDSSGEYRNTNQSVVDFTIGEISTEGVKQRG